MRTKIKICGLTDPAEAAFWVRSGRLCGNGPSFKKEQAMHQPGPGRQITKALDPPGSFRGRHGIAGSGPGERRPAGQALPSCRSMRTGPRKPCCASQVPVWKAFNGSDMDLALLAFSGSRQKSKAFVFDAALPGSGKTFDWDRLRRMPNPGRPFFLAGGLGPGKRPGSRSGGTALRSGRIFRRGIQRRKGQGSRRGSGPLPGLRAADQFLNEEGDL